MAYATQGRQSVTMPGGIRFPSKAAPLNALLVVAYGWRSPARAVVVRMATAPGRWISPLLSWTRPMRRAA